MTQFCRNFRPTNRTQTFSFGCLILRHLLLFTFCCLNSFSAGVSKVGVFLVQKFPPKSLPHPCDAGAISGGHPISLTLITSPAPRHQVYHEPRKIPGFGPPKNQVIHHKKKSFSLKVIPKDRLFGEKATQVTQSGCSKADKGGVA